MQGQRKTKEKGLVEGFSKNLRRLRQTAVLLTENKKMKVKFDRTIHTSCVDLETHEITLSLKALPDWILNRPVLAEKCLDGILAHECGHEVVSLPVWQRFNNWCEKIKNQGGFKLLAHVIVNITEDVRVDHFINLRYRHDFGKRLLLERLIVKDSLEEAFRSGKADLSLRYGEAPLIISILCNEGKYGANCKPIYDLLSPKGRKVAKECVRLMHTIKYKRLGMEIVRSFQEIYDLIEPFIEEEEKKEGGQGSISEFLAQFMPKRMGGQIEGELSEGLKKALTEAIKKELEEMEEKKKQELLDDLLKGSGAGEGTGEEIPAPEPNFDKYQELVSKNKSEITRLLNMRKVHMKAIIQRRRFQKRGKIMPPLLNKAYASSFRNTMQRIYMNVTSRFEKEQVAIGFLFDFSGSVNRTEALDITTILNEVFGNYVDDYGYAVACFGANSQKVKTFFETFENTKARVGNIGVNSAGTEVAVLLRAFLKMFNNIKNRRKILVIASDFSFGDDSKARELIEFYPRAGVELIFIGFSNCYAVDKWGSDLVEAKRTKIREVSELPEAFLKVYLNIQES